jgi:hypothetical protein
LHHLRKLQNKAPITQKTSDTDGWIVKTGSMQTREITKTKANKHKKERKKERKKRFYKDEDFFFPFCCLEDKRRQKREKRETRTRE